MQVDALVGEEVRRCPEDPRLVVIGQDPDQSAVHVENDRSDIHALRQCSSLGRASATSVGPQGGADASQQPGTGDRTVSDLSVHAACSILFARDTSLLP